MADMRLMTLRLTDGRPVLIRALGPTDRSILAEGIRRLSAGSRLARFLHDRRSFSDPELDYLTQPDQVSHIAFLALICDGGRWMPAGVGRAVRLRPSSCVAEVALAVVDAYQRLGLGRCLLKKLATHAASVGITQFQAIYRSENAAVERWVMRSGGIAKNDDGSRVALVTVDRIICDPDHPSPPLPDVR